MPVAWKREHEGLEVTTAERERYGNSRLTPSRLGHLDLFGRDNDIQAEVKGLR